MNIIQKIKSALLPVLCAGILVSCQETDYMKYDVSRSGIYFTKDTLTYSFGVTPVEQKTYEYRVPIALMGAPVGQERNFVVEVIADSTTAIEGEQYILGKPVVPADSIGGYIPVTILRDGLAGDHKVGYSRYKLGLRLLPGNGFEPTLETPRHTRVFRFDNAVEQPEWLGAHGQKIWIEKDLGKWHPLKLIVMVDFYHEIDKIQPETYVKLVKEYGENLERNEFGDFYKYRATIRKFVFDKTYKYFQNPANRDYVLDYDPNFPFDFPSPFGE